MEFGVFDHLDHSGGPLDQLYENRLKLVEAYDRAGLYAYHLAEHHSTPLGCAASPSVFLAAVAQRTKQLRFGPLVYTLPYYNPMRLIEEICMLDQMSGGRFQLGIGRGVSHYESEFYGIDFEQSQWMYHEAFQMILKGLASEELTFEGKFYRCRNVPMLLRPRQRPHPPLWYGIAIPESADWPAANDVNIVTLLPRAGVRAIVDRFCATRAKLGKSADRMPLMGITRHLVVAGTDAEAERIACRAYPRWRESFTWLWKQHGIDVDQKFPMIAGLYPPSWDELQSKGNGIAGSPATVRAYIAEEAGETGINYFVPWLAFGELTLEESLRSVELYAGEVIPALAGARTRAAE